MTELTIEQVISIKRSYYNIIALFLEKEKIESRFLRCLLKWGFQLRLQPDDLQYAAASITELAFLQPTGKLERIESIYHLVYMIYLDDVVEDVELEVSTIYAQRLGFKHDLVSELFKSIATADDMMRPRNVREEVMDFLKTYEA